MRKFDGGYEGFCIDLLDHMAAILRFNYTIIEVSDGSYGIEVGNVFYSTIRTHKFEVAKQVLAG